MESPRCLPQSSQNILGTRTATAFSAAPSLNGNRTGADLMSDDLLLSSLWLIPLIGAVIVLFLPKQFQSSIKWVALGATVLAFIATLIAANDYLGANSSAANSLQVRAEKNKLKAGVDGQATESEKSRTRRETSWSVGRGSPTSTSSISWVSMGSV